MAEITKLSTASPSSMGLVHGGQKLRAIPCGENIAIGDALCLRSDGKLWKATGAAANANARCIGFAPTACDVGEVLTPIYNVIVSGYASGLTPGAPLYVSGTVAGGLADAASTGGTGIVAYAISATDIIALQGRY
jgi:broad specificity polyphosphatase/5'/3'-nucleotidase SurE